MYKNSPEFLNLCDLVLSEKLVIMTGSGISLNAVREHDGKQLPSWTNLITEINSELQNPIPFTNDFLSNDLILSATLLSHIYKLNNQDFYGTLRKYVKPKKEYYSDLHEAISQLNPFGIITLNFDDLHEKSYEKLDKDFKKIIPYNQDGREKMKEYLTNKVKTPFILKAHGCVNESDDLIIEESGFKRVLNDEPIYREFIQNLLVNNTFLFIGFGFADADFNNFLDNIISRFGGPLQNHLRVQTEKVSDEEKLKMEKYGISSIYINNWSELDEVIKNAIKKEGPKLSQILIDAVDKTYNKTRSQSHDELRNLSQNGKEVAANILLEKIESNKNNDWLYSEYIYSLGCIEPKSVNLKEKIKINLFNILETENRAEAISHCLAKLDFYIEFSDLSKLEKLKTDISKRQLIDPEDFPDNKNRMKNYFNYLITRLWATEHRKGMKFTLPS